MKRIVPAVSLCVPISFVFAEGVPAPLGMKWGDSEEVITKNYGGEKFTPSGGFEVYLISSPPIKLDGIDRVIGIVHEKIGLAKIIISKDITDDAYDIIGDGLYNDYKKKLEIKYGKPESYEYINEKVYTQKDEFYQCLSYDGCGSRASFFTQKDKSSVAIELVGKSRGNGKLRIYYESKEFADIQKDIEDIKNKKDSAGL